MGHIRQKILGDYNGLEMQTEWRKSDSFRKMVGRHLVNVRTSDRVRDGKDTTDIEIRGTGCED
jgi:hypothetical protein